MALSVDDIRRIVDTGNMIALSDADLLLIHEIHEDLEDCTPPAKWVRDELIERGVIDSPSR